jgi:polyhydroxybutyrate depolymerase
MSRFIQGIALFGLAMVLIVHGAAAESMQLVVDGRSRTIVFERSGGQGPRPTIIMLHGAGGDRTDHYFPGLAQIASRVGFVTVRPQGVGGKWNIFPPGKVSAGDTQFFNQQGGIPDDVAFLTMVIADLTKRGVSDPRRIYLAGLSLGGVMTLRMACVDVEMFAGLGLFISAMPEVFGGSCRMAKPVPVLMISGTADQRLPYAGGQSAGGETIWATERLHGFFRNLNGCAQAPLQSTLSGTHPQKIEVELSATCSGAPVHYYRVIGGGHDVPRSMTPSQMLVDFFRDKVR